MGYPGGSPNIYRGQLSCNDHTHTEYNQRVGSPCGGAWTSPGAPAGIFLSVNESQDSLRGTNLILTYLNF